MRRLYLLVAIFVGFTLSSCTAVNKPAQCPTTATSNKPNKAQTRADAKPLSSEISTITIPVYADGTKIKHPYKVIAKESVSKFNLAGIKRQEACIHDALRNLAAAVGGDAVINVTRDESKVTGTVVSFDKNSLG